MTAEEIPAPSNNTYIFNKTEREKKVIELYFAQRKSIRDIATELRMSFATITNILNRYKESKQKKEQDALVYNIYHNNNNGDNGGNGDARSKPITTNSQQQQHQQQLQPEQQAMIIPLQTTTTSSVGGLTAAQAANLSPNEKAAIAYKLYDEGKTTVDVDKMLLLRADEALGYYKEFWKLKHHYDLYHLYPTIRHEIPYIEVSQVITKVQLN